MNPKYDDVISRLGFSLNFVETMSQLTIPSLGKLSVLSKMVDTQKALLQKQLAVESVMTNPFRELGLSHWAKSLEGFSFDVGFHKMANSLLDMQTSIAESLSAAMLPRFESGLLLKGLPDLSPLMTRLQELAKVQTQGEHALEESGYGFLSATAVLAAFAEFAHIEPRALGAAMTNALLATTRGYEFEAELRVNMQASTMLRRRWPVVSAALAAHRQRTYLLSVPALLAQVEGAIADALIVKGNVKLQGTKLYEKDETGNVRLGKKGKPVAIAGLDHLVRHSKWHEHEVLSGVAGLATDSLAGDRNAILHGRRTTYGRAKLSVILLLSLHIISREFANFEDQRSCN